MRLVVIGAGGHAKVVVDAARLAGFVVSGVLGRPGDPSDVLGVPVITDSRLVLAERFIVAIGDNAARAHAFDAWVQAGLEPATVVHPSAVIARGVVMGPGTFVAAGVVVNVDARIGSDVILNTGCTVDHDCEVGDHALIGPAASLCGGARIGEGTLLGAGAAVLPRCEVGSWSVVGAGAAVTRNLPDRGVYVGVPARRVRVIEDAS